MRFTAAVLDRVGAPLALDTLEMAPLGPADVLVRIRASGLCHTDLEVMRGSLAYPLPIVLGHEGAGVVEAVGAAVTRVKPGDHVVCSWNPHCGACFYCERALPILCEPFTRHQPKGLLLDGTTRMTRRGERGSRTRAGSSRSTSAHPGATSPAPSAPPTRSTRRHPTPPSGSARSPRGAAPTTSSKPRATRRPSASRSRPSGRAARWSGSAR